MAASLALLSTTALTRTAFAQDAPQAPAEDVPFSFDRLTEAMREKAKSAFSPPSVKLPDFVSSLTYDTYRLIQFKPDHAKWAGTASPYQVHAFHPGWLYKEPVEVFEVVEGKAHRFDFTAADFDYHNGVKGSETGAPLPAIAGFRINYPLNRPDAFDELVVFLGASYFRALGKGNTYGLSARGLVLNCWRDGPEEFPLFTAFYLEKPSGSGPLVLHAALESESVTGAYRFVITPGEETDMEVTARLFFRKDVGELGVAPLTSMFLFADNNRYGFDDYRMQVHDSNGLSIQRSGGEVLWRALNNPPVLGNSYFADTDPVGFGLHQRDRDFDNYQDAGAHYEKRPSLHVEPLGGWGAGSVRLIEVPSRTEADDNIIAFWVPDEPVRAGDEREFRYRLHWGDLPPSVKAVTAYVADTRAGQGGVSGVENAASLRKFVVDFRGDSLDQFADPTQLEIVADVSGGTLKFSTISRIEANGLWRLVLDVEVNGTDLLELRAHVAGLGRKLTETWLYQWRAAA